MISGNRITETIARRPDPLVRRMSSLFLFLGLAAAPMAFNGVASAQSPSQLDHVPHFESALGAHVAVRDASRNVLTVIQDTAATEDYDRTILKMEVNGGSVDYGDGTQLSSDTLGAILSLSYKTITGLGATTFGAFVEGGTGSYETKNYSSTLHQDVRGDGQADFMGGGLFFYNMFSGRAHVEASVRAGAVSNNYGERGYSGGNYDISTAYYGAHLGLGQIFEVTDLTDLDVYGQFHWARTGDKDFRTEDRTRFQFDSVDSYRTRLGARLTQIYFDGDMKGYIGAAWEHEFDGEAGGRTVAGTLPGSHHPDLKGSNAFGEAGLIIQPVGGNYAVDIGVFGVGGAAKGVGGTAGLKFEF